MDFVVKTRGSAPAEPIAITAEMIAGQRVGSRLDLFTRHDLTIEFADGAALVDDIDLMIYIIPNEFFCYRGDDFIVKFILDSLRIQLDQRPADGPVNPRLFISSCRES